MKLIIVALLAALVATQAFPTTKHDDGSMTFTAKEVQEFNEQTMRLILIIEKLKAQKCGTDI